MYIVKKPFKMMINGIAVKMKTGDLVPKGQGINWKAMIRTGFAERKDPDKFEWCCKKSLMVVRDGIPCKLKPGDLVPEAKSWRNLQAHVRMGYLFKKEVEDVFEKVEELTIEKLKESNQLKSKLASGGLLQNLKKIKKGKHR